MNFTAQSKKLAGALTFNKFILAFVLLIVLVGQVSALPAALPGRKVPILDDPRSEDGHIF
jgi:hypothetical protein